MPNITFTIVPVPAPSGAFSINDTAIAARLGYQPIYNIDYPGQDLIPWRWVRDYEACLRRCESWNFREAGKPHKDQTFCKAALFAPARIIGKNDCYLKKSLDHPQLSNITLLGGIKIDSNASAGSNQTWGHTSSLRNGTQSTSVSSSSSSKYTTQETQTSPMTSTSSFKTSMVISETTSSTSKSDTGRPSISFSPKTSTESSSTHTRSQSRPDTAGTPTPPHVSTASELSPSGEDATAALTVPTARHTHGV
jgi:hypothetical protein